MVFSDSDRFLTSDFDMFRSSLYVYKDSLLQTVFSYRPLIVKLSFRNISKWFWG